MREHMTPKQRMLVASRRRRADRLPATTHFMMPQFLQSCMGGISEDEFFDTCGWDPITYTTPHRPDPAAASITIRTRASRASWKAGGSPPTSGESSWGRKRGLGLFCRRRQATPPHVPRSSRPADAEHGVGVRSLHGLGGRTAGEGKTRHRLIGEYVTAPKCDVEAVNRVVDAFGQRRWSGVISAASSFRPARHLAGRHLPGRASSG